MPFGLHFRKFLGSKINVFGSCFLMNFWIDFLSIFDEKWPPKVVVRSTVIASILYTFPKGGPKDARGALWIDFGAFFGHFGRTLGAFWDILRAFWKYILEIMVRIRTRFRSKSNQLF